MKKELKFTKNLIFIMSVFGMLVIAGCGAEADMQRNQEKESSTDREEVASAELSEAEGNQEKESSAGDEYELVYAEDLETKEGSIPFEVWLSQELFTDSYIKIDGQKLLVNPALISIGYAHPEPTVCDFTGDGKEEIALVISGGASGAVQAVQVFTNKAGTWTEMEVAAEIYDFPPEFLEKKLEEMGYDTDPSVATYHCYSLVSIEENKILLDYYVFNYQMNTDPPGESEEIGTIQRELYYSSDQEKFVLGDIQVQ